MSALSNLETQMDEMKSDMREVRTTMQKIADALSRLAVLEERHQNFATTIDRRLGAVEQKASNTELEQVKFVANVEGISKTMKFMWAAFGSGVVYIGSQLFQLVAPHIGK